MPFFSRGRLNLSRTLFNGFGGGLPPVLSGLKVGQTSEPSGGSFYGFGLGVGSLLPQEFLSTGQNITKLGVIAISDFANNGDFASNGDFALAEFSKLTLGEGLPDVGDIEITINGITTTAAFSAGSYESADSNAQLIYDLLSANIGSTYSFSITSSQPQNILTSGVFTTSENTEYRGFIAQNALGFPSFGGLEPRSYLGVNIDAFFGYKADGATDPVLYIAGNFQGNMPDLGPLEAVIDGASYPLQYGVVFNGLTVYGLEGADALALYNATAPGQDYVFDIVEAGAGDWDNLEAWDNAEAWPT